MADIDTATAALSWLCKEAEVQLQGRNPPTWAEKVLTIARHLLTIDVVFDGPPSHESGRFVEVETIDGKSIQAGEWIARDNGYWALRISRLSDPAILDRLDAQEAEIKRLREALEDVAKACVYRSMDTGYVIDASHADDAGAALAAATAKEGT